MQWETSNQKNVVGFEIEKSVDAKTFIKIGFVSSAETGHYAFTDTKLIDRNNYYRLKIVDQDDRFNYSNIISIFNLGKAEINLFPNPVQDELNIISTASAYHYQIYDLFGRVMISGISDAERTKVPCTSLQKGIYFVKIDLNEEIKILKFTHD